MAPLGKLGKLAPKANSRTLRFSRYLRSAAPLPEPLKTYWEYRIPGGAWGMLGNDQFGDCTCAGPAHELMNRTAHTGAIITPSLTAVLNMYQAICPGFDPATGANDNGAAITDALNYMQTTGLAGHKILGWAQVDQTNIDNTKAAIYIFGSVNIGVNLPNSAMDQTQAGKAWDVVSPDGGIAGGHCVTLMGYGAEGATCITWGQLQPLTWAWFRQYCDEAYAEISLDWLASTGRAPNLLNLSQLNADLAAVRA